MPRRSVSLLPSRRARLCALALIVGLIAAILLPPVPAGAQPGGIPRGISQAEIALPRDGARPLAVRASWPRGGSSPAGGHPVIIFSHGMFGSGAAYGPLIDSWAAAGYVVLQPTHPDSRRYGNRPGSWEAARFWDDRPEEIALILDALGPIEDRLAGLAGGLDRERVGVGGHSFGAQTAMLIGGVAPRRFRGGHGNFRDRRVTAVLAISPQGPSRLLDSGSFAALAVPTLFITGSEDTSPRTGQGPDWRRQAYDLAPLGGRHLLFIEGAHHGFGGISGRYQAARAPGSGPDDPDQVEIVRRATLAFWDAHLRDAPAAFAALTSGRGLPPDLAALASFESK